MDTKEILTRAGERAVDNIQKQIDALNLSASGKARSSISFTATDKALYIEGLARVVFMIFGRASGKMPPIDPIRRWVEQKLGVSEDESEGIAWGIAKKIAKEGTNIFNGKAKGLRIEVTLSILNKEILSEITTVYAQEITGGLVKDWGKI